jgi:hypothetical protein
MPKQAATRFVLSRLNWVRVHHNKHREFERQPGEVRVAAFGTAEEAEAERRTREETARAKVNPFLCNGFAPFEQTSMPEGVFRDWLLDHGLDPPTKDDWAKWWKKGAPTWTADQRSAVWEACDKVRFYAVTARPAAAVVYAVVDVIWNYNDQWYDASEAERVTVAYRSRMKAEAECDRLNAAARRQWRRDAPMSAADEASLIEDGVGEFDLGDRRDARDTSPDWPPPAAYHGFVRLRDALFYEVVELEVEGRA